MARYTYDIVIIREGRDADYHAFWKRGVKVNQKGESLHPSLLSFSELIKAKNLNEAIEIAQKKYPACTVARENSSKLG